MNYADNFLIFMIAGRGFRKKLAETLLSVRIIRFCVYPCLLLCKRDDTSTGNTAATDGKELNKTMTSTTSSSRLSAPYYRRSRRSSALTVVPSPKPSQFSYRRGSLPAIKDQSPPRKVSNGISPSSEVRQSLYYTADEGDNDDTKDEEEPFISAISENDKLVEIKDKQDISKQLAHHYPDDIKETDEPLEPCDDRKIDPLLSENKRRETPQVTAILIEEHSEC